MEDSELVKKMISGIDKPDYHGLKDSETKDFIDELAETGMVSLKEAIEEITEQIKFRESLHKEMLHNLEELKSSINNMAAAIASHDPKVEAEFKKKLIEAEEMKIQEKLNCFRDIAMLKKELREWIREFRDKEKRADLFGGLMSD